MSRTIQTLILAVAALSASPADSLCDEAARLFFNRHLAPGNLDSAYQLLAGVRTSDPRNEQCLYLWSRLHVQLGDLAATGAAKLELYARARAVAETLRAVNDANPEGHMWWVAAHGRIGQTRGVMNSLFMVPTIKRELSRVLELDPRHATACDAFGVLYYELPGIVGGNLRKSEEYLVRGLNIDPNYTLLRLDLARVYVRQRRWPEAREQLDALCATIRPTFPADFELDDRPEALRLLTEIRDR